MAIWKIGTCKEVAGYKSRTSIYALIQHGLWTKPVHLGKRCVGWPHYEVNVICAARTANKSEAEIKELVCQLHTKRLKDFGASLDKALLNNPYAESGIQNTNDQVTEQSSSRKGDAK